MSTAYLVDKLLHFSFIFTSAFDSISSTLLFSSFSSSRTWTTGNNVVQKTFIWSMCLFDQTPTNPGFQFLELFLPTFRAKFSASSKRFCRSLIVASRLFLIRSRCALLQKVHFLSTFQLCLWVFILLLPFNQNLRSQNRETLSQESHYYGGSVSEGPKFNCFVLSQVTGKYFLFKIWIKEWFHVLFTLLKFLFLSKSIIRSSISLCSLCLVFSSDAHFACAASICSSASWRCWASFFLQRLMGQWHIRVSTIKKREFVFQI